MTKSHLGHFHQHCTTPEHLPQFWNAHDELRFVLELQDAVLDLHEAILEPQETMLELQEANMELQEAILELQEAIVSVQGLKTMALLVFSMKNEGFRGVQGSGFRGQGLWC